MDCEANCMTVREAILGRRAVRRFLPDPVGAELVRSILDDAARAPSGTNTQPWLVHVVTGEAREHLCREVEAAALRGETGLEYDYSLKDPGEPYISRRRRIGFDLYALHGVERGDLAGRRRVALLNYDLFGAPVGLFFCMERRLLLGSWLDMGLFMQNVMLLARAHGLETCPQQAWCELGPVVHRVLGIPEAHVIVSGMAMGFEDKTAKVNTLRSVREPVSSFATFHT